jgi:hypothetical protein
MRVRNLLPLTASLSLGFALFAFPATVHADTYEIFSVGNLQFERFYGLATDGTVVISYPGCGYQPTTCYETLVGGQVTAIGLTTVPNLIYDNGTPCAPTDPPAGMTVVGEGVCNDGKEVFMTNTGLYFGYGLYTGSDALNVSVRANAPVQRHLAVMDCRVRQTLGCELAMVCCQAAGVRSARRWMEVLASPGRTAAR